MSKGAERWSDQNTDLFISGHVLDELLENVACQRKLIKLQNGFLDFKGSQIQVLEQDH